VDVWAYVISGGPVLPEGNWSWNWPPELNGTYYPYDYSSRGSFSSSFAGCYTVSANAWNNNGSDSDSAYVYVVEVAKLQYWDEISSQWVDITGTLYVVVGDHVVFKAVPNPGGAFWPTGKPVWSGSSGASGTGETVGVGFHTLSSSTNDYKTVTATCGNTVTVNVVVYDFEGVLTPDNDFDYRNQDKYGLEEIVHLTFITDPAGITAAQAGGLEWDNFGAGVVMFGGSDGTATYDACASGGYVTFFLSILSGPSKLAYRSYYKDVITPSGTRMTRVNPNNVYHIQGLASAGIKLYYWLDPKNVSFTYLTFGEGSCPSTNVSGFYLKCEPWFGLTPPTNSYPNGTQQGGHPQNTFGDILGGNIITGCRVNLPDYAFTGAANPYAAGSLTWNIPTQYIDDTGSRNTFGSNSSQVSTYQANGDATQTKSSAQPGSAALNDEDSGY
jgi:hypothetical protein